MGAEPMFVAPELGVNGAATGALNDDVWQSFATTVFVWLYADKSLICMHTQRYVAPLVFVANHVVFNNSGSFSVEPLAF